VEERRRNEDTRIDVLTERVENWMTSTTEYRKSLCSKIDAIQQNQHRISDEINSKIVSLPCSKGHDVHVDRQLNAIWWIVSVCLLGVVSVGVAWGSLNNQVDINTQRWNRVLQEQSNGERN
jgi:hypothetical protein